MGTQISDKEDESAIKFYVPPNNEWVQQYSSGHLFSALMLHQIGAKYPRWL